MGRSAIRPLGSKGDPAFGWLAGTVLAHFVISIVHVAAHAGAHVLLSPAATLYVFVVILAGPLIGLTLTKPIRYSRSDGAVQPGLGPGELEPFLLSRTTVFFGSSIQTRRS